MPPRFLHALGTIKAAAARVNRELGLLEPALAEPDRDAPPAKWPTASSIAEFPIDVFQTGSGTSTNMNANEVIARRAAALSGQKVHPNDHVNFGQSSNDVIPATLHVAALLEIERDLIPALQHLHDALERKAREFDDVIKTGRTHLMDATPIRLGQEFGGYASQVEHAIERVQATLPDLRELAIGGTAVGTGLNTHPEFGQRMAVEIGQLDRHVVRRGAQSLRGAGCAGWRGVGEWRAQHAWRRRLMKIANDVRLMNSGPRCGLAEITLPAIQPGLEHHARQGEPGDLRGGDPGGRPGDGQPRGDHGGRPVGSARAQHHAAADGAQPAREHPAPGGGVARCSPTRRSPGITANAETCRDYVEISPEHGDRAQSADRLRPGAPRSPSARSGEAPAGARAGAPR